MKANTPDRIWVHELSAKELNVPLKEYHIEYVRKDAFIEKAKKWFEEYNEWFDLNGNRHCDMESFEDFKKYLED